MADYDYEYDENKMSVRINCLGYLYGASIEDFESTMERVMDIILQVKKLNSIILAKEREYEYGPDQVQMLVEIASIIEDSIRQKIFSSFSSKYLHFYPKWPERIKYLAIDLMRRDPIGAYVEILREIRELKIKMKHTNNRDAYTSYKYFIVKTLNPLRIKLEKTKLIRLAKPYLTAYHVGDRTLYRQFFMPIIRPNFMLTRYMIMPPKDGISLDRYNIGDTEVEIFKLQNSTENFYHIIPPEFKLSDEKYSVIDEARRYMATHKPRTAEFVSSKNIRDIFYNIGRDIIRETASRMRIHLDIKESEQLAAILTRYTAGFGILEVLLADEKLQDIFINSPIERQPILVSHEKWGECRTNIIPTMQDAEAWATRLRIQSGRPLDESNPVLDTDLDVPGGSARFAVITRTLSPEGLAFAIRRHRDRPWTLPLFIKNRFINPLAAGLFSFLIDGSVSILVAGGRSGGKTSLLASLMIEILPKTRIVSIEDTLELPIDQLVKMGYNIESLKSRSVITNVETEMKAEEALRTALRLGDSALIIGEVRSSIRGNEEVVIVDNGETKRVAIKDLEGKNLKNIYVPTLDEKLKVKLTKLTNFVKHPKREKLLEIITRTGRSITVTHDHSVFTANNFYVHPIETSKLKRGDKIVIPSSMPLGYNDIDNIDLTKILHNFRLENAESYIRKAIKILGWKKASKICDISDIHRYLLSTQKTRIPIKLFLRLMKQARIKYNLGDLRIKRGTSNSIPAEFSINENIMRLIGYYLAEGNIDKNKIQITNSKTKIIEDVRNICQKELGLEISQRKIKGYGTSVQMYIKSKPLLDLLLHIGCGRTSFHKRIPKFVYGLNEKKICALLKGMYSGDGSFSSSKSTGNTVRYFTTSKKLAEDVAYLLLTLSIVGRIHKRSPNKNRGKKDIFIVEFKERKYVETFLNKIGFTHKKPKIMIRQFPHTRANSVSFDPKNLEEHLKLPRKYRHLRRTKQCSKDYLKKLSTETKCSKRFSDFANGEFYLDEIKDIKEISINPGEHVYDLSVNPTENFIGGFGGIVLHNTEAKALYEAMRIGALSNVIAGTIHGESAFGVYDRVVNDLGVPPTSFKATDIIPICKSLRSADGLHKFRRVTEITEIRKEWEKNPQKENGFVSLMEYSSKTDELKPTDVFVNGESEILNRIASYVKEWSNDWSVVWENIKLRGRIKQAHVTLAEKLNNPDIMEAEMVVRSNQMFHKITEMVTKEIGSADPARIYEEWHEWMKDVLRNKPNIII